MHPNGQFHWDNAADLLAFAGQCAFARIFAATGDGLRVAHAPIIVRGGRLRFHLARNNALIDHLDGGTALLLVEGPNAYVSANWYPDPRSAVPTWNYVAAEFEGAVQRLARADLIALLDDLAETLEPRVGEDWTRAKMDAASFDAMLGAIVPFELTPTAIRATRKLSQNKRGMELAGVVAGLTRSGADAMVAAMNAVR